jgi:hypothetical protein
MSLSMYQASIPVFIRTLGNLAAILTKAAIHADAKKIDPLVFINARLTPDMFPLSRQIQIATDIVKGGAARLSGSEAPSAKTIAFLKTFDAAKIDGTEDSDIQLKVGGNELNFKGQAYLLGFVLPNLYFHTTITYAILRHNGVELGKKDFLGSY